MGSDNFSRFKITETLAKGDLKLMPEIFINGGGSGNGGAMDGLMGLKLMEMMDEKKKKATE